MPNAQVIGLGRSGIAAARLLKQAGWQVTISDRNSSESLRQQQQELNKQITVKLDHSLDLNAELPSLIVVSPGVPWDIPVLVEARNRGIDTIGEMELAWRHLKTIPWVAITGTNGKTTTTALIAAIFAEAGLNAPACGNIGYAACEVALSVVDGKPTNLDWVIAEISSYQIESAHDLAPQIGIWTTFTPDHLSRHKKLENYYDIKASLLKRSHLQIINGDDPYLHQIGNEQWINAHWTSVKGKDYLLGDPSLGFYLEADWVVYQNQPIVQVSTLRMVGEHNQQNLLMAVAAAHLAGIDQAAIQQAIANFPGVPHRLEHIITWQNIDFINDSKATNYDAAQVGLAAVAAPAILIAGGDAKAGDDSGWLEIIKLKAATVLLIGDAANTFAQRLKQVGYENYEIVETMTKAVPRAAQLAQKYQAKVVLLSPACASFDQYQSFEHRGDDFRQICWELP
ncbi:MAG: UDP-N-acetylmuramoyl-L-alanine--D-glutamate ligase [Coleofasciculaceae cyanobacterium]